MTGITDKVTQIVFSFFLFNSSFFFLFIFAGIYFTRDITYAAHYSRNSPKVFVVAAVNPGNTFPVTEHPFPNKQQQDSGVMNVKLKFMNLGTGSSSGGSGGKSKHVSLNGKPGVPGYQSHYAVVPKKNIADAFPLAANQTVDPVRHADELVVFQDAQALPLFIIYTS